MSIKVVAVEPPKPAKTAFPSVPFLAKDTGGRVMIVLKGQCGASHTYWDGYYLSGGSGYFHDDDLTVVEGTITLVNT